MLRTYQNSNIKDANNPNAAGIYSSFEYLLTKFYVWYKIAPAANPHMPTENQRPKLKPNNEPAIMSPIAIKKPTVKPAFKKEKSFLVTNTMADNPVNKASVTMAAWFKISSPESI